MIWCQGSAMKQNPNYTFNQISHPQCFIMTLAGTNVVSYMTLLNSNQVRVKPVIIRTCIDGRYKQILGKTFE
jgi:hypothetical protein